MRALTAFFVRGRSGSGPRRESSCVSQGPVQSRVNFLTITNRQSVQILNYFSNLRQSNAFQMPVWSIGYGLISYMYNKNALQLTPCHAGEAPVLLLSIGKEFKVGDLRAGTSIL